jgi:hypothetical protein
MAVSIPREIYTLGAVQFSTQPLAQLQGQLLAKKAAKEEALNKYFYDLQGKINTAGVRQVDVAGIDQDIKNWQQSWSKDAKGLQKLEHQANYQNILRRIDQSKNRAKLEMDLGKMRVEGKYDPDEDDLQVQQRIGLSVYDPRSYKADGVSEYGLGDLSPSIPEFDATKQNQFFSAVTKGKTAGEVPDTSRAPIIEKGTGYIITPFKKEFSKEQIIAMANDAGELTKADRVSRKYYNRILGNPESDQFINLKAAYDILSPGGIMDTPEEVAKADAFIRFSQPVEVGTKRVKEEDWRERAMFQAFLKGQTSAQEPVRDIYREIDLATSAPDRLKRGTGAPVNILSGAAQNALIKLANDVTGRDNYSQSKIYVKKFSDGKNYIVDVNTNEPLVPFTKEDINIGVQVDVKGRRGALTGQVPVPQALKKGGSYSIKGKDYTESQLLKMGYTKEQIAPYLKK